MEATKVKEATVAGISSRGAAKAISSSSGSITAAETSIISSSNGAMQRPATGAASKATSHGSVEGPT